MVIQPEPQLPETIAVWIWALQDTRTRTRQIVEDLAQAHLDYLPDGFANSIGTLLYHLAATEISWLYEDVLGKEGQQLPADLQQYFVPGFWVSEQDRRPPPPRVSLKENPDYEPITYRRFDPQTGQSRVVTTYRKKGKKPPRKAVPVEKLTLFDFLKESLKKQKRRD